MSRATAECGSIQVARRVNREAVRVGSVQTKLPIEVLAEVVEYRFCPIPLTVGRKLINHAAAQVSAAGLAATAGCRSIHIARLVEHNRANGRQPVIREPAKAVNDFVIILASDRSAHQHHEYQTEGGLAHNCTSFRTPAYRNDQPAKIRPKGSRKHGAISRIPSRLQLPRMQTQSRFTFATGSLPLTIQTAR